MDKLPDPTLDADTKDSFAGLITGELALGHLMPEDFEDDDFALDDEADNDEPELVNYKIYPSNKSPALKEVVYSETEKEEVKTFQLKLRKTVEFLIEEAHKITFQCTLEEKG